MNSHVEATKLPESVFVFPSHRRSHLRSDTYRTLLRVLSHCYENGELSLETEFDPQELRAANDNHLRQENEKALCKLVGGDFGSTESGDSASHLRQETEKAICGQVGGGFGSTQSGDLAIEKVFAIGNSHLRQENEKALCKLVGGDFGSTESGDSASHLRQETEKAICGQVGGGFGSTQLGDLVIEKVFAIDDSHLRQENEKALCELVGGDFGSTESGDSASHLKQETEKAICGQVGGDFGSTQLGDLAIEKVFAIDDSFGIDSVEDGHFHGTEVEMDYIRHMGTIERSGDAIHDKKTLGTGSHCNDYVHEENYSNELEHIMEGNDVLVHVNNNNPVRSLNHKDSGNDQMTPKRLPEEIVNCQQIMAEEGGSIVQKISGTIFSLDDNRIGEVSKPEDGNEENKLLVAGKGMDQWIESQPKELEIEGIVCECDAKESRASSSEVMEVDDVQQHHEKVSEAVLLYLDKVSSGTTHDQSENNKDKATSLVVDISNVEHEMLSKDMQMDGLPLISETVVSPNFTTENEDIEEGEICGDDGVSDISTSGILEDPKVLSEKVVDIQMSEETINKNNRSSIQTDGKGMRLASFFSDTTEYGSHENKEDFKQDKSSAEALTHGIIGLGKMMKNKQEGQNDLVLEERGYRTKDSGTKKGFVSFTACASNNVLHDQVPNESGTGPKEIISAEKETGVCNKKKRGPLSEGKKEKKKLKKRKKRAEMNRKLGVKRLRLQPVTVPKPVVYCRHYLKGRCQQGDKCKFSHDTIPLTKSTPCTHYARHSCMKGDDCPFDHQLSKYPCSNFASKGSCIRGDTCMFSHKVLQKEASTCTPNLKTEFKPPLISDNFDSHRKLNSGATLEQNLVAVRYFSETARNNTPQSKAVPKKTTEPPPVGINFLSFGTPLVCSRKIKPVHSSEDGNDNVEARNVLNQNGSCLVENSYEPSRKISSETTPKGIDFLSFGKPSQDVSSHKAPSSYDDGMKPSQLVNSSLQMQVSTSPFNASVTFGNRIQRVLNTGQSSNEMLKKAQTSTSTQMNVLFPKALIGKYVHNDLVGSSSDRKVNPYLSEQNEKSVPDMHESSSTIIPRQPCTPISSDLSSHSLTSDLYKGGTPNSAQKAIFSTLAFAAKYESLMNKNKSSGSSALTIEGSNEGWNENTNKSSASASVVVLKGNSENISRSLKNDQAKASKNLDFLLGLGIKSGK